MSLWPEREAQIKAVRPVLANDQQNEQQQQQHKQTQLKWQIKQQKHVSTPTQCEQSNTKKQQIKCVRVKKYR